jgi:hypothetical protein
VSNVSVCTQCPRQFYKDSIGTSPCIACKAHSHNSATGSQSSGDCLCDAGYWGSLTVSSASCNSCPVNTFKSVVGTDACTACPPNSVTHGQNARTAASDCKCSAGYTGTLFVPIYPVYKHNNISGVIDADIDFTVTAWPTNIALGKAVSVSSATNSLIRTARMCFMVNTKYRPLDDINDQHPSVEADAARCQARCALVSGCAYYSFWPGSALAPGVTHNCHLSSSSAVATRSTGVQAGPAHCPLSSGPNCTDGNVTSMCQSSSQMSGAAYLLIDLAARYTVHSVVIYNRWWPSIQRASLNTGVIRLCATSNCTAHTCLAEHIINTTAQIYTWDLSPTIRSWLSLGDISVSGVQWILIQQTHGRNEPLNLMEVKAMGFQDHQKGTGTQQFARYDFHAGPVGVNTACSQCRLDTYKDRSGTTPCTVCPPHSTTAASSGRPHISSCICDAGYTGSLNTSTATCSACPTNTYKSSRGAANCEICPAFSTTLGVAGQTAVTQCKCIPGYTGMLQNNVFVCSRCPVNTYKIHHGGALCDLCNPHSSTNSTDGQTNVSACLCSMGYTGTLVTARSLCTACPADTYKTTIGTAACTSCTANSGTDGFVANQFVTDCMCDPGFNGDLSVPGAQCHQCAVDTYMADIYTFQCVSCPHNSSTLGLLGSTSITACFCSPGFSGAITGLFSTCTPCAAGKYKTQSGDYDCDTCPDNSGTNGAIGQFTFSACACNAGWISTRSDGTLQNMFQDSCNACSANFYKDRIGPAPCVSCAPHSSTENNAAQTSIQNCKCDPGYQGELTGPHISCTKCALNTFKDESGPGDCDLHGVCTCKPCPVYSNSNRTMGNSQAGACLCEAGYSGTVTSLNAVGTPCGRCPGDTYKGVQGTATCISCVANSGTRDTGATAVSECMCNAGFEGTLTDTSSVCTACPAGKYKQRMHTDACSACPANTNNMLPNGNARLGSNQLTQCTCNRGYSGTIIDNTSSCTQCEEGKYKDQADGNPSVCTPCPVHSNTHGMTGATVISSCLCIPGYTGILLYQASLCQECVVNTYKDTYGPSACIACPANTNSDGTTGNSMRSQCKCGPGWTGDLSIAATCTACPANSYKSASGNSSCVSCPSNSETMQYTGVVSLTGCKCSAGFEGSAVSQCKQCAVGLYKEHVSGASCTPCPDFSNTSATGRVVRSACLCDRGYTGNLSAPGTACLPCSAQTFKVHAGTQSCDSCPGNSSTAGAGVQSSMAACLCNPGFQGRPSYLSDGEFCMQCPPDTYKSEYGPMACTQCPQNSTTGAGVGLTQRASCDCAAGYTFRDDLIWCVPCAVGFYKPLVGYGSCIACGLHKSTRGVGSPSRTDCECAPGYSPDSRGNCARCPTATYKEFLGPSPCTQCPISAHTLDTARTSIASCLCNAGFAAVLDINGRLHRCQQCIFDANTGVCPCAVCPPLVKAHVSCPLAPQALMSPTADWCQYLLSPSSQNVFTGALATDFGDLINMQWTIYERMLDNSTVRWSSNGSLASASRASIVVSQVRHLLNLVVRPNSLFSGASYRLQLTGTSDATQSMGTDVLDFTMNRVPENGTFAVSPRAGSALNTTFLFQATNWTDDPEHFPLTYAFAYLMPATNASATDLPVWLANPSTAQETTAILPQTTLDQRGNVSVAVLLRVTDLYNAAQDVLSNVSVSSYVKPSNVSWNDDVPRLMNVPSDGVALASSIAITMNLAIPPLTSISSRRHLDAGLAEDTSGARKVLTGVLAEQVQSSTSLDEFFTERASNALMYATNSDDLSTESIGESLHAVEVMTGAKGPGRMSKEVATSISQTTSNLIGAASADALRRRRLNTDSPSSDRAHVAAEEARTSSVLAILSNVSKAVARRQVDGEEPEKLATHAFDLEVQRFSSATIQGSTAAGGKLRLPSNMSISGQELSSSVIKWNANPFGFAKPVPEQPHVPVSPKGGIVFAAEEGLLSSRVMTVEVHAGSNTVAMSDTQEPFIVTVKKDLNNRWTQIKGNCSLMPCINTYDLLHSPQQGEEGCDDLIKWRGYTCAENFCTGCPLAGFCDKSCGIGCGDPYANMSAANGSHTTSWAPSQVQAASCVLPPRTECSYWDARASSWRLDGVLISDSETETVCAFDHLTDFGSFMGPPAQTNKLASLKDTFDLQGWGSNVVGLVLSLSLLAIVLVLVIGSYHEFSKSRLLRVRHRIRQDVHVKEYAKWMHRKDKDDFFLDADFWLCGRRCRKAEVRVRSRLRTDWVCGSLVKPMSGDPYSRLQRFLVVMCSVLMSLVFSIYFFQSAADAIDVCEGTKPDGTPQDCDAQGLSDQLECTCKTFVCTAGPDCDCNRGCGTIADCAAGCPEFIPNTYFAILVTTAVTTPIAYILKALFERLHKPYRQMLEEEHGDKIKQVKQVEADTKAALSRRRERIKQLQGDKQEARETNNPREGRREESRTYGRYRNRSRRTGFAWAGETPGTEAITSQTSSRHVTWAQELKSRDALETMQAARQEDEKQNEELGELPEGMVWYTTHSDPPKTIKMTKEQRDITIASLVEMGLTPAKQPDDQAYQSKLATALPYSFAFLVGMISVVIIASVARTLTSQRTLEWLQAAVFSLLLQWVLVEPLKIAALTPIVVFFHNHDPCSGCKRWSCWQRCPTLAKGMTVASTAVSDMVTTSLFGSDSPQRARWRQAAKKASMMRGIARSFQEQLDELEANVIRETLADVIDREIVQLSARQEKELQATKKNNLRAALKEKHTLQRMQIQQQMQMVDSAVTGILHGQISRSMRNLNQSRDDLGSHGDDVDEHTGQDRSKQDSAIMMGVYKAEVNALQIKQAVRRDAHTKKLSARLEQQKQKMAEKIAAMETVLSKHYSAVEDIMDDDGDNGTTDKPLEQKRPRSISKVTKDSVSAKDKLRALKDENARRLAKLQKSLSSGTTASIASLTAMMEMQQVATQAKRARGKTKQAKAKRERQSGALETVAEAHSDAVLDSVNKVSVKQHATLAKLRTATAFQSAHGVSSEQLLQMAVGAASSPRDQVAAKPRVGPRSNAAPSSSGTRALPTPPSQRQRPAQESLARMLRTRRSMLGGARKQPAPTPTPTPTQEDLRANLEEVAGQEDTAGAAVEKEEDDFAIRAAEPATGRARPAPPPRQRGNSVLNSGWAMP